MPHDDNAMPRRRFLKLTTTAIATAPTLLSGLDRAGAAESAPAPRRAAGRGGGAAADLVRIASVPTAVDGGLLPVLIGEFEKESGLKTTLFPDVEPYLLAGAGKVDLVISHFGHRGVEEFVLKGMGLWPRTVFSNQLCLFGPPADPARVAGLASLAEAFRRIVRTGSYYVMNETRGLRYLTEIMVHAAGIPPRGDWFIDPRENKEDAIKLAAKRKAYVLWGLTPFLEAEKESRSGLVPLVTADPILQRIMVSIVVNPDRVPGANRAGAERFERFLLDPATQARIMTIHYPGAEAAVWAPAGRHNSGEALRGL